MKAFEWVNPTTVAEAVKQLSTQVSDPKEAPRPLAGGQDLLTTMKDYITQPVRVVNLKSIPGLNKIEGDAKKGLKLGALVTLSQLEEHPEIRKSFPAIAEAAHSVASTQIRNLGTLAGNLCQRPRCWYFRLEHVVCLKKGGDQCYAEAGENKYNAILGGGPSYIVHPSDLAPALVALGASVVIVGPNGNRTVELEKFFKLPSQGDLLRENVLADNEIITEIQVPASPVAARSTYLKFKERDSLDFALSAVAAAVELDAGGKVKQARLVLGGVAPTPWRVPKAESYLVGKKLDEATLQEAAKLALEGAQPLLHNQYKVPLTQTLVRRALNQLGSGKSA
ncbi:MAG TPA: xanthine dehydrogenase family protein subunit M [Acidobacteriota bacterium]|nr:xanthine dehydrogenase family protein subunit M [Acidobacteriota bacterium]HMZ79304.1 xanthine dehydrogenase family protein subunit M [Acidobacteriota bacterium]HNB72200.1 xanthine dehydrogenase family protein subunit M [Acidobacteriota bacterium]HNG94643.1 xanthine dehydrogenase family protein subunit M [Acidobacteriota bacterium]HNH82358.1 xanthine dehydrogenase family protein subunit M [Acidobacteriota bacterium]